MAPPNATPPSAPEWYATVPSGTALAAAARAARRSSASLTRLPPRFLRSAESPVEPVGVSEFIPPKGEPPARTSATSSVPSVSPSSASSRLDPRSSASSPPHPFHPASVGSFVVACAPSRVAFSRSNDRSTSADAPPSTFKPFVAAHSAGPGSAPPKPAPPAAGAPPWRSSLRRSSRSASCSAATRSSSAWNASREDVTSAAARSFSETRSFGATRWGEPGATTPPGRPRRAPGPPTVGGSPRGGQTLARLSDSESIIDLGGGRWMSSRTSSSAGASSRLSRLCRRPSSAPWDERR
mmetsp:Transcript_9300/g.37663  ORF Transcript_9300/g.37663 Transcript_9300/m.37663 type:complete len:296 (+) Transcript_9300:382-1269(+)